MKKKMYTEACYLLGLFTLALGTVLMTRADFGVGMVVAPAYVCYLTFSRLLPWFTFGMAEYLLQAALLIAMCLFLGRFRLRYLWSAVTVLLYGLVLDGLMALVPPVSALTPRLLYYAGGLLISTLGVSFMFHTYIPPAVYELVVSEVSKVRAWPVFRVKTVYDCASCAVAVVLSLVLFGALEGIGWGTVVCAVINGTVISLWSRLLEHCFRFENGTKLHKLLG